MMLLLLLPNTIRLGLGLGLCSSSQKYATNKLKPKNGSRYETMAEQKLINLLMNREGIMLLRGVGRAGSAIVCYGRRRPPICHLLMCQYSSLSKHKSKVADEAKILHQKLTKADNVAHHAEVNKAIAMVFMSNRWPVC